MKVKGFTLIELLVVILIIGILLALIIPNFVLFQERARRTSVKNNMHIVQTAMEAFATDHFGQYPTQDVNCDWEDTESIVFCYFPGGDPIGQEGEPIPGNAPVNPYTGNRYNSDNTPEVDLTQDPEGLDVQGQNAQLSNLDPDCPYEIEAENGVQGAISILGYIGQENVLETIQEYGICGYGRDVLLPMFDRHPTEEDGLIFYVLHN